MVRPACRLRKVQRSSRRAAANDEMTIMNSALPQELKDAGWKLGRKIINDDEEHPVFYVSNERLKQSTDQYKTVDEAIRAAVLLQLRSEGQKIAGQRAVTKRLKEMAERKQGGGGAPVKDELPEQLVDHKLIRIDGGTQPRAELDQTLIREYADEKKAGAKFPAVDLFFDGSTYWLAHGFHRFFSDRAAGFKKTFSRIHQGTQRDAILFSAGANFDHGKRRSDEDKRRAVLMLLADDEWKVRTDSWIAEQTHTAQPTVSKIRRELANHEASAGEPSSFRRKLEKAAGTRDLERFKSETTKRTTKTGRKIDTKAIGKKPAAASMAHIQSPANKVSANGHAVTLPEEAVIINMTIQPGKTPKRKLTIGARAGERKPLFRTDFTTADLEPTPCALREIYAALAKEAKSKAKAR